MGGTWPLVLCIPPSPNWFPPYFCIQPLTDPEQQTTHKVPTPLVRAETPDHTASEPRLGLPRGGLLLPQGPWWRRRKPESPTSGWQGITPVLPQGGLGSGKPESQANCTGYPLPTFTISCGRIFVHAGSGALGLGNIAGCVDVAVHWMAEAVSA